MPQLATLNKCTGCSACASICAHTAISMIEEQEGYLVPTIDREKCVHCKVCVNQKYLAGGCMMDKYLRTK